MSKENLYTKPTEEEYEEVKDLTKTNKKILTYSILTIMIILATIMHFTTIVNIINSTLNFIGDVLHYIFVENLNIVKQLTFVTIILLTNALLLIHVKTLKHVTFKRHRPNYLKKYSNAKFWSRVYSIITIPLLYLVYGSFTQFLTLLLVIGIHVSIYTYISITNIKKLYPELPPQKKEMISYHIEYFKELKKELKKHFGYAGFNIIFSDKKQINELNTILNFRKFLLDYNKNNEYKDILKNVNNYIIESKRTSYSYTEIEFDKYDYDEARNKIDFNKLKEILKEHNVPIINYIHFSRATSNMTYTNRNRFKVIIKNNIFY